MSAPRLTAAGLALVGAALGAGGAWLAWLGGTPAYLVFGALCLVSAVLLWRGRISGAIVYGATLTAIWGWSLWEVGFDPWALAPRVILFTVIGMWLLTPFARRGLTAGMGRKERRAALAFAAAAVVVLATGLLLRPEGWSRHYVASNAAPAAVVRQDRASTDQWDHFGGDAGGSRFSGLEQITPANVGKLEVAWTADIGGPFLEATPLKVGDSLYVCNGQNVVRALDAETGRIRWTYDAKPNLDGVSPRHCRGVGYARLRDDNTPCAERIFASTLDARLIALDARSGRPCAGFGDGGVVRLKDGLNPGLPGYYVVTSAPTVALGRVIVGSYVTDNQYVGEPSGVVRAFDAETGRMAWAWNAGETHGPDATLPFTPGTPNVWGPMSADEALGLVYLPVGNATPDYWGAHRSPAADRYASSVTAVDVRTGATRWSFQTVHHDVWDYDVASQPTLIDVKLANGAMAPAVLQTTKRGQLFLLDRRDGRPLSPVVERAVPQGGAAGERLSPTQPYSVGLPALAGPPLTERDMWGVSPFDQLYCRILFRQARYEGEFTPPGADRRPTIQFPGFIGGSNWGGLSVDPERQLAVLNTNHLANYVRTIPRAEADARNIKPVGLGPKIGLISPQAGTPFAINTGPFLSPLAVPCQRPPFGKIWVIDLQSRRVLWSRPLGSSRDVGPLGVRLPLDLPMGSINLGGSLTTRSGLIFITATQEQAIRAFDLRSGELLWKARLPAGSQATPMTYRSASGRQFIVVASGGHRVLKTRPGEQLVAYALPQP